MKRAVRAPTTRGFEQFYRFFPLRDGDMSRSEPDRVVLFIDGVNLHATARTLGFDIDYKRLLNEFQNFGTLLRAFYYTTLIEDQENSTIRPLIAG